jgi:hypothetical protein
MNSIEQQDHRAELISALHLLAWFLADHPDVPVPPYSVSIQVDTDGTDAEQRAAVDAAAAVMGVETSSSANGTHYEAAIKFGPVKYYVLAIDNEAMDAHDEKTRLGREAYEALHAKPVAEHADGCCADGADCVECRTAAEATA